MVGALWVSESGRAAGEGSGYADVFVGGLALSAFLLMNSAAGTRVQCLGIYKLPLTTFVESFEMGGEELKYDLAHCGTNKI